MPCDQIILNQVEIGTLNPILLGRALGFGQSRAYRNGETFIFDGIACRIVNGKLIVPPGSEHLADLLKRKYSAEVVKYTAARNGWTVKETKPYVYQVVK